MQTHNTLAEIFSENVSDKKFIHEIETGKIKSHKEILEKSIQISNNDYIKANKIATVILPNSLTYVEHFLAAMFGGYIFNPLPYFTQTQELEKIFEYIDPAIIITDREDINHDFSKSYHIYSTEQFGSFSSVHKRTKVKSEKTAALYYSSGTTGNPKGVLYSHKNMVSLISSIVRGFKFTSEDSQFAFLPFGHTAAINYNILPALLVGCDLYISQGFEKLRNNFFDVLEKYKITYTEIVPTILFMLNKLKVDIGDLDLSKLEFIGCGSSTLPLSTQNEFIEQYGIKVGNLYGLSETGPTHIDDPRESDWSPGSAGVPLDVNECRISEDGEILLKGDNVFKGYHKNKKLYEESVIKGWFNTGDLGEERDGKLFFIDRKKDLIIKSGINIVPMEIEEIVHKHPAITECVAVGKTSTIHGEDIAVIAVKNSDVDSETVIREIKQLCRNSLSAYKVPNQIFFWESIPKTPSKKLLRRKVRDLINSSQKDIDISKSSPNPNK